MALLNFDVTKVEPSKGYDLLPPGKYLVEVTASEEKEIKGNKGTLLQLELTVIEGDFKNRKLWVNLCTGHIKPEIALRARGDFSAICHAVDRPNAEYSEDVHHLPFVVNVKWKKDKETDELHNEVNAYYKYESQFKQSNAPASAPANNSIPPWKR